MSAAEAGAVDLSLDDLREVTGFAAASSRQVLAIFEAAHPGDSRPRDAVEVALAFAGGGNRGKRLRDAAWAALRAAGDAGPSAAGAAARAAMSAASAAYLHPLSDPHQVKHILGAAAYAARATELAVGDDGDVVAEQLERARQRATPVVVEVLLRYPPAPPGGGRVGELIRALDDTLRATTPPASGRAPDGRSGIRPVPAAEGLVDGSGTG